MIMKRHVAAMTICFILFMGIGMGHCTATRNKAAPDTTKPMVVFEPGKTSYAYDMGWFDKNGLVEEVIVIKNNTGKDLAVREARSGCGCMQADIKSQRVPAGKDMELTIAIDTRKETGDVNSTIYILTDNEKYEVIALILDAHIKQK